MKIYNTMTMKKEEFKEIAGKFLRKEGNDIEIHGEVELQCEKVG